MYLDVNQFAHLACDSDMLQAAVDAARETGESVVVPRINKRTGEALWQITKTVYLHSGTTLILQNAHLRMADDVICNMFANKNARTPAALTKEGMQSYITIRGEGRAVLDGGKHNGLYEVNGIARTVSKYPDHACYENCMVFTQNVEHLLLENLTVRDQRYWAFCLNTTSHSRVSGIHFESSSNVPCQDGVDLMRGCHDVIVENITGCVGDNIVALLATDDEIYPKVVNTVREGDIHNITIRNLHVYGVGGCALVRLLNHDGYRIYNVKIDNLIETSPWSMDDAPVAQNPDLVIRNDEEGNIYHEHWITPGEIGYRCEAAILIGESYWYNTSKAQHGDTFGISVSNVMTHARYALFLNNTLLDSSFDNIRLFGNGYAAAYFGEGTMERVRISNVRYDKDCRPLPADEHIFIEWNNTRSDGFACFQFNDTHVKDLEFADIRCAGGMDSVFGGRGEGNVICSHICHEEIPVLSTAQGITVTGG
ncbi:MAG: hypothetical protein J6J43_06935 [Oscillospiraceae bacterium]|nr:hypothetical protein [Oscillospiraceae bacterium]